MAYLDTSYFYEKDGLILVLFQGMNLLDGCSVFLSYYPGTGESYYSIADDKNMSFENIKKSLESLYSPAIENDISEIYKIAYSLGYIGPDEEEYVPDKEEGLDSSSFASEPKIDDCYSCGLISYRDKGKWGYLDSQGNIAIKPQWDYASSFEYGYAYVFNGLLSEKGYPSSGVYALINTDGNLIIPYMECDGISIDQPLEENVSISYKTGSSNWEYEYWGINGKPLSGKRWDNCYDEIGSGLRCVYRDGKWGYVDSRTEETVIDFMFDDAAVFSDDIAEVAVRGENRKLLYYFIDPEGNTVIPNNGWDCAGSFDNSSQVTFVFQGETLYDGAIADNGKYAVIDRTGRFITGYEWDDINIISDALIAVAEAKGTTIKWGIIDRSGNVVVPPQWDYISDFTNGYAFVFNGKTTESGYPDDGLYGFINSSGQIISEIQWTDVGEFTEDGYAVVESAANDGKIHCGIINRNGELVIPAIWDGLGSSQGHYNMFIDGLCPVMKDGLYGYINKEGDLIIDTEWDDAKTFMEGLAVVWDNGSWYIIDPAENVIVSSKTI